MIFKMIRFKRSAAVVFTLLSLISFSAIALPSSGENRGLQLKTTFKQARSYYDRRQFNEALTLLTKKLLDLDPQSISAEDSFYLPSSYVLLGALYHEKGQRPETLKAFETAAKLRPKTELNEDKYSPYLRILFEETRQRILFEKNRLGKIKILSPKKAQIFLNGSFKGMAPLEIKQVPQGLHYLVIKVDGKIDGFRIIEVESRETEHVAFTF